MPYLGNVPAEAYTNTVKDSFNGDASTTAFTLSQPSTTNNLRVVVENVIQDPTVAYTVSGTTLTFTSAPPVGTANIYAVHLGPATQTAVPPSEINNATTYTSDLTVQGAFTSQGIDDNANATAITIDSSENVLVGKTTTAFDTQGIRLESSNGKIEITRNGNIPLAINRLSSDGDIVEFYKDGTEVGSIGTAGADLVIGTGSSAIRFRDSSPELQPWNVTTNAAVDATMDIGASARRFKDLYLSGGVYLGGTSSDNYLNDYEHGFFEPSLLGSVSNPTVTWDAVVGQEGWYVKVGRMVHIQINFRTDAVSGGSGNLYVGNLPFASPGLSGQGGMSSFAIARSKDWGGDAPSAAYINEGTNFIILEYRTTANGAGITSQVSDLGTGLNDNLLCISGTYYVS